MYVVPFATLVYVNSVSALYFVLNPVKLLKELSECWNWLFEGRQCKKHEFLCCFPRLKVVWPLLKMPNTWDSHQQAGEMNIYEVVYFEFVQRGQIWKQHYYIATIWCLQENVQGSGMWGLVSPPRQCVCSLCFVRAWVLFLKQNVVLHPPGLPDLALCKFFLLPRLKMVLKGGRFNDITMIQQNHRLHIPSFKYCAPWIASHGRMVIEIAV